MGSLAPTPDAAQSFQAFSPEAQAKAIAQLNATASAPAPLSTGLTSAQQLVNQPCTAASGTATQISGSGTSTSIQKQVFALIRTSLSLSPQPVIHLAPLLAVLHTWRTKSIQSRPWHMLCMPLCTPSLASLN